MIADSIFRTTAAFAVEGEMTIYRAVELQQALLAELEQRDLVELDLSKVSEIDTAGVQLLLFAKQVARAKNKELRLGGRSPAVVEVLELLNLAGTFGDPPSIEDARGETP